MAGLNGMTGSQAFLRIALTVVGVLWLIVSAVSYSKFVSISVLETKMTIMETMSPQTARDHELLMTMLQDQGKRETMLTEAINIMRELRAAILELNVRYTALQLDLIRLQAQTGKR